MSIFRAFLLLTFLFAPIVNKSLAFEEPAPSIPNISTLTNFVGGSGFGNRIAISDRAAIIGAHLDGQFGTTSISNFSHGGSNGLGPLIEFAGGSGDVATHQFTAIGRSGASIISREAAVDFLDYNITTKLWSKHSTHTASANGFSDDSGFGNAVATFNEYVAVGAPSHNGGRGAVVIFRRVSGSTWARSQIIHNPFPEAGDLFGGDISMDANTLIIGAIGDDIGSASAAGSVYVYRLAGTTNYQYHQKLVATNPDFEDFFGISVAITSQKSWAQNETIVVGTSSDKAYIFEPDSTGFYRQKTILTASDGFFGNWFGFDVAVAGNRALIGAPVNTGIAVGDSAAYYFTRDRNGNWTEKRKITSNSQNPNSNFGRTVAISRYHMLIGDPESNTVQGRQIVPLIDQEPFGNFPSGNTLSWNPAGSVENWLYVGTNRGTRDIFDSGSLSPASGGTIQTINALPTTLQDSDFIWVRIWYRVRDDSTWYFVDNYYFYLEPFIQSPSIVNPTSGSTLTGSNADFTWNPGDATEFWLYVGSTMGGRQYYDSGNLGTAESTETGGLPTDGSDIFARLWHRNASNARWVYIDWVFTAATLAGGPPARVTLIGPSSTTNTNTPTYSWNVVQEATWYYLWVNDSTGNPIRKWYRANEVGCANGGDTCSINSAIAVSGNSTWWVRAWNANGNGPWSSGMSFVAD